MSLRAVFFFISCILVSIPFSTYAQFSQTVPEAFIDVSPRFPDPYSEVKLTLNTATLNTTGTQITWFIDGVKRSEFKNSRTITITTGNFGGEITAVANLIFPNGAVQKIEKTISVVRADITIEADTFVSPFYKGRSLPSVGSTVRASVVPFDGSSTGVEQYSYTWRLNNKALEGGSIYGKNYVSFILPIGRKHFLGVDVNDSKGNAVVSKTIIINTREPEVLFYEDNPLKGLSRNMVANPHIMVQDEIKIHAEPYYLSRSVVDSNMLIEWKIDGKRVNTRQKDFGTIVLQRSLVSGVSNVEFHIRDLNNYLQGVKGSFRVQF